MQAEVTFGVHGMRVDEVTDEPLYRDRVCGIDIGKAGMAATIRVPSEKDRSRRAAETREFGTTRREVLALADWLRCWQVRAIVMEATGTTGSRSSTGWRPRASSASWPKFRLIREHTRYRRDLTGDRTREKQRAEKLLESAASAPASCACRR
jgi:transposase